MKLYGLVAEYSQTGEIREFEVDRETDKTYVIKDWKNEVVNKSTMSRKEYHYYLTYKEALEAKTRLFKSKICDNKVRIEFLRKRIDEDKIKLANAEQELKGLEEE